MAKMGPKIFMSYARSDGHKVLELYSRLRLSGFRPWMDTQDLLAGEHWRSGIERAIRESDFCIVCISNNSVNKRGFLQKEIKTALDIWREKLPDDIYLIPLRLQECNAPESLSDFQWLDLFEKDGWERLLRSIEAGMDRRRILQSSQKASPESTVNVDKPVTPAPDEPANLEPPKEEFRELPLISFPRELAILFRWLSQQQWQELDDNTRRTLVTLGTKLEPILQIVPATPVPLVIGFECLALGGLGESFSKLCRLAASIDPGHLRLLLALAAMKTAEVLRTSASEDGNFGSRHLQFTLNLDPETLDCPQLNEFLDRYRHLWKDQFIFEVSERTSAPYLRRLRNLQVDFKLRYCADDYNSWDSEAKKALRNNVEMTKVDFSTFRAAMDIRGINPKAAIAQLNLHKIVGKPLIVEGLENEDYFRFLDTNWPHKSHEGLFGQGYRVKPGPPWENWTTDLQTFGLPGGHILKASNALYAAVGA